MGLPAKIMTAAISPASSTTLPESNLIENHLASGEVEVSVIVPALNEAANLPELASRVASALAGRSYEIVIVDDDSRDGTQSACEKLAADYPLRLLIRKKPQHGLSGAVLEGIAISSGKVLVVMDADLQHPPERIVDLIEALTDGETDFALGSRYVPGGSTDAQWTLFRRVNSGVATVLAKPFAGPVRDPMSGFFALSRSTFDRAERLTPLGYKIALELMCKCRVGRVKEVPIHFGLRSQGESKLSMAQQFRYMEHLSRLYDFKFPRASPIIKFVIATSIALLVGIGGFGIAIESGAGQVLATCVGYAASVVATAVFHARYVRIQRGFMLAQSPWGNFALIVAVEYAAVVASAFWLRSRAPLVPFFEAFLISFFCGIAVRYVMRKEMLEDVRGLRGQPMHYERATPHN